MYYGNMCCSIQQLIVLILCWVSRWSSSSILDCGIQLDNRILDGLRNELVQQGTCYSMNVQILWKPIDFPFFGLINCTVQNDFVINYKQWHKKRVFRESQMFYIKKLSSCLGLHYQIEATQCETFMYRRKVKYEKSNTIFSIRFTHLWASS